MGTRRQQQRQETTSRVLATAHGLFLAQGFIETTIRDIAGACGVSVGTVMAVGDKNTLLAASFDQLIEQIHRERPARFSDAPCPDQVLALLRPFVELFTERPALARRYGSILVAGDHESVVFEKLARLLTEEIADVLETSGCASEQPVMTLAESVYFAYIGRLFTWPPDHDGDTGTDADNLRDSLLCIVSAICRCTEDPR